MEEVAYAMLILHPEYKLLLLLDEPAEISRAKHNVT